MEPITAEQVRQALADAWEGDTPDEVLEVFRREAGKPFTKRILAKLPGGEERWRIDQIATMTNLEEREYMRTQGDKGYHFLVAYATKHVVIDPVFLEEKNTCHFSARKARNAKRLEAQNDAGLCQKMADRINWVREAQKELNRAEKALMELTEYGEPMSADAYVWEGMADCKEDKP